MVAITGYSVGRDQRRDTLITVDEVIRASDRYFTRVPPCYTEIVVD